MRVLIEIVHPANVLFFLRPIRMLMARGDDVVVVSREKDVAAKLLDAHGVTHITISKAGSGLLGLAKELLARDLQLLRLVRRMRPDIMIGFGGVAISHVGKVLGIPAISFYDTEVATLQTAITWPFIRHLYVPSSYQGRGPRHRMTRVPGHKELSYFHPASFRADPHVATRNGWDPDRENYMIRLVSWRANHDLGKRGWRKEQLRALIDCLTPRGKVHLTSERELPEEFSSYAYSGATEAIHHVLGMCRIYVGESATMACEAAVLGVASIYASDDFRGYIDELARAGLVHKARTDASDLLKVARNCLAEDRAAVITRRDRYLSDKPDWAHEVIKAIDTHAS